MAKKKTLVGGLLDITVGAVVAAPAITTIQAADIPAPLKTGASSLIGVALVKGAADLSIDEKKRRLL